MLGVMFEPYQLQSDMEEYGFYVTMDTADTSIHIYDAYEGYAKEDSYRIPAERDIPTSPSPIRMEMAWWWPMARLSPTGDGS